MKMPEAKGAIPFKISGIERVTGLMIDREPMVRVKFQSGFESDPVPLIPTMRALLELDHNQEAIEPAFRKYLDAKEVRSSNKKDPVGSGIHKGKNHCLYSNRSVMQKPF